MIIAHEKDVFAKIAEMPGVKDSAMKMLIGEKEGWPDYVMRIIEVQEGGHTPKHAHPWPHINYMIEGRGALFHNGREHTVQAGSFAFVPADSEHQFRNIGEGVFRFICIVPREGHK